MKFIKLSLITALAVTTAMAGDAKLSGDAKLFYSTSDGGDNDLFSKAGSIGDTALELKYSRDLKEGITVNAGLTGVSTLGLENELVSGTWVNHNGGVADQMYIDTANIVAKVANTTLVVGRQALDTPFFYSETWNIVPNTFDAAVAVNNDIQDTTLVAAWVGRGNGDAKTVNAANGNTGFVDFDGNATTSSSPAYAFGLINKSIPNTAAQAWYYQIPTVAKAYWLQADTSITKEISAGLQYANAKKNGAANSSQAAAVKVGYAAGPLDAHIAYSKRSSAGKIDIANIATGGGESKLYTEAFWNYGLVGSRKAQTIAVGAGYDVGTAQLGFNYTSVDTDSLNSDVKEAALTATTKIGPVDTTVAFINTDAKGTHKDLDGNTVQAYLTVPFSL